MKEDYDPSRFQAHSYLKSLKMRRSQNVDLEHFLRKTTKTPFMPINIKNNKKLSTSQTQWSPDQDSLEYEMRRKLIKQQ